MSVPEFDWDPVPVMSLMGDPEGNEIYLPTKARSRPALFATVTVVNSVATYRS